MKTSIAQTQIVPIVRTCKERNSNGKEQERSSPGPPTQHDRYAWTVVSPLSGLSYERPPDPFALNTLFA
jgi:hypothetical protein